MRIYLYTRDMALRKSTLTRLILGKMSELGAIPFDAFFPPQYSYAQVSRRLFGMDEYPDVAPRTVSSLLSRLRRQGLVARRGNRGSHAWTLTKRGAEQIAADPILAFPAPDGISRLVVFDIPEKERRKRDIIRTELASCNFRSLQKSVWIGENPLPEDFIALVDDLRLKGRLHIFSIRESGTIEEPETR